jgi:hypothetical protein
MKKNSPELTDADRRIASRLDPAIAIRFVAVLRASKRHKTSLLEESLEAILPDWEKQYLKKAA